LGGAGKVRSMAELIRLTRTRLEMLQQGQVQAGLLFGFAKLDEFTGGIQERELALVAGRPGDGKTAYAIEVARRVTILAKERKVPFYFASLEMSGEELAGRFLCATCRIDSRHWRAGNLKQEEWDRLSDRVGDVESIEAWIDDRTFGISQICGNIRRVWQRHKIGLAIVDFVQLVAAENHRQQRYEAVGEISRKLKLLAKELKIPVLALAQLGRGVDDRAEGEPELSDLRESGNLESDADLVMLLYTPKSRRSDDHSEETRDVYCKVAKNRQGPQT
jgi:replicative DNA helicase